MIDINVNMIVPGMWLTPIDMVVRSESRDNQVRLTYIREPNETPSWDSITCVADDKLAIEFPHGSPVSFLCRCGRRKEIFVSDHRHDCLAVVNNARTWPLPPKLGVLHMGNTDTDKELGLFWAWFPELQVWQLSIAAWGGERSVLNVTDYAPIVWSVHTKSFVPINHHRAVPNWQNLFTSQEPNGMCPKCGHEVKKRIYYPLVGAGIEFVGCMC